MNIEAEKRFSPMKFTLSQQERNRGYSPKNKQASVRKIERYYCHHSNCIYMGGIDSFNKNGKGILLFDEGSCAITNYIQNRLFGHIIIFHNHSLTSMIVDNQSNKDICFRYRHMIFRFKIKRN